MMFGGQVYEIVWAGFAICIGVFVLFFMDLFIKGNSELYRYLFDRSGFRAFKYYANNMDTTSVRITAYIASIVLILLGLKILFF